MRFLASHPYHSGCPHANDMVVMTPIFADGELIAFAASIGHTPDTGGVAAGTRNATARDLFGEGLLIPRCASCATTASSRTPPPSCAPTAESPT